MGIFKNFHAKQREGNRGSNVARFVAYTSSMGDFVLRPILAFQGAFGMNKNTKAVQKMVTFRRLLLRE